MERKLAHFFYLSSYGTWLATLVLIFLTQGIVVMAQNPTTRPFSMVVYLCVWQRPLLTEFVLSHFDGLKKPLMEEGIELELFITGSNNTTTHTLSTKFSAAYAVHPNSPLGAKHDKGIQSMRKHFEREVDEARRSHLPDAVSIFGSDDIVNMQFFVKARDLMSISSAPRFHVIGLRDLYFQDLKSKQLVYTRGYRSFETPMSGTVGCGRAFSWTLLGVLEWHLWDVDRERGLDQSAIRNVMKRVPLIGEVSSAIFGREYGIVAMDIKSDAYATGTNIWKFEEVVEAVGRNGRFYDFVKEDRDDIMAKAFGAYVTSKLDTLRITMVQSDSAMQLENE